MIQLERGLRRCSADLARHGQRFAVVGGLAVSVRAEPRLTRDADVVVSVTDDDAAEALVRRLLIDGYEILAAVEQDATKRLATMRLTVPGVDRGVIVDLLFASSGIEPEIVQYAERLSVVAGLVLPVAVTGHLVAMKLLARDDRRRPNDADDLAALRTVATDADWRTAEEAVALIEARGFARGRDLSSSLRALRAHGAF